MLAQVAMMRLAAREMQSLVVACGLRAMVRSDGALELYESEDEWKAALPGWDARAREGICFEHVRGGAIAELQPGLSPRFKVATFVPGWKTVSDLMTSPGRLPSGWLRGAAWSAGARSWRSLHRSAASASRWPKVPSVVARKAVIACGAWSRPLALGLGDPIPLETERGYNTTLPTGALDLRRQLTFAGHGFVVTPLSSGIRVGGAVELGGLTAPPNFKRAEAMLRKAARFLPGLKPNWPAMDGLSTLAAG